MKRFVVSLVILLLPAVASAHLETGTYEGVRADGQKCAILIEAIEFRNGLRHPLNERVAARLPEFAAADFSLSHPARVDFRSGSVGYVGSELSDTQFLGDRTIAVRLTMVHSPEFNGPASFDVVTKTAEGAETVHCSGLSHRAE